VLFSDAELEALRMLADRCEELTRARVDPEPASDHKRAQ
jgi:hypothetical protein